MAKSSVPRPDAARFRLPGAGQLLSGTLVPAVTLLLPLALARPERLLHPSPWLCFLAAATIYVTQPPLRLSQALATDADGKSVLAILAAGLLVTIAPVLEFGFRAALRPPAVSGWVLAGTVLVVGGTALRVWAISVLGRFFTAVVTVQKAQPVVDSGPYRWVRHPSYTGALVAALGGATLCQSWAGLGLTLGLLLPAYLYRIQREERHLRERLGEAYVGYAARTTKLVPYLW